METTKRYNDWNNMLAKINGARAYLNEVAIQFINGDTTKRELRIAVANLTNLINEGNKIYPNEPDHSYLKFKV